MSESRPKKRKVEFIESYWTGGEFGSDYQWNDNHGELIRCKDCKHRPTDPENKRDGQYLEFPDAVCPCQIGDNWYSWMPKDNWFCADGERRGNVDG